MNGGYNRNYTIQLTCLDTFAQMELSKVDDRQTTFSAHEAVAVQEELRRTLALEPEQFPLPAFIGMISDEIDQFRDAGRSDADVVALIKNTVGRDVTVADIERFYAPPQARYSGDPPG
jgi:hypothetical protein